MKQYHYCYIMAGVYVAPHVDKAVSLIVGGIFLVAAFWQMVRDK